MKPLGNLPVVWPMAPRREGTESMSIDPQELAERAARFINEAGADSAVGERIAAANTIVHFHLTDAEPVGWTLFLDRTPIRAEPAIVGQAEIELCGTTQVMLDLYTLDRFLAIEILKGAITWRGPVRKLLRVGPMIRHLASEIFQVPGATAAALDRLDREAAGH